MTPKQALLFKDTGIVWKNQYFSKFRISPSYKTSVRDGWDAYTYQGCEKKDSNVHVDDRFLVVREIVTASSSQEMLEICSQL